MYGFQPKSKRSPHPAPTTGAPLGFRPQHLADGGLVQKLKGMMGLTPEDPARAARLAEYKANAEREKAAAKAASAQATAPAPQAAISQYSGMSAMQRREKELGLADGGLVRGLADAVRPFSESVGGYWSNSNKEFEATNPGVGGRIVRAVNPVTGLGSAVGAMYDAAGNGSARDAAIAAVQAYPMFAAMKVVPAAKSMLPIAPQVAAAVGKTASKVTSGTGAGVVVDEAQARGFANGGMIRGPGTGTSDSISTKAEPGTFIMPADSTKAIGPRVLEQMGKKVPVRLSNGEYEIPPEQVMGIGAAVLELMKESTHEAAEGVDEGEPGDRVAQMLASGGMVENDVTRVGNSYSGGNVGGSITVNGQAPAGTNSIVSTPALSPATAPTTPAVAPASPGAAPTAPGVAQASAVAPATTPAPPAPMGWAERNAQRNLQVSASSILDSPDRTAAQAALAPPPAPAPAALGFQSAAQRLGTAPSMPQPQLGFQPRRYADGGTVKDEERAVFGLYPQMIDNQRTTYATADKLRSGVVATGPNTFATALTPKPIAQPAIRGGGDGRRMNAQQDPRSLVYAGRPQIADTAAVAPAQAAAQGQAPAATVATNAPAALSSGSVSAQDDAAAGAVSRRGAADALAQMPNAPAPVTAPTVRNSTNDWAARKALENAATAASSITANGSAWDKTGRGDSQAQAAYKAALATDQALQQAQPGMDQAAMRENAGIQREGMQQAGATTRTGLQEQGSNTRSLGQLALEQQKVNQAGVAQGFQTRAAQQQEQLRNVLVDPKATPEQRAVAQRDLAALNRKPAADRMQTVTLPDTTNEMGQVVRGGQALVRTLEDGSVQQVPIGAQQVAAPGVASAQPKNKAEFDALPKGARFTDPNGQVRIK